MYSPQEIAAISAAENLMRETMARYDPSHDAWHVERVRKTALTLAHYISAAAPDEKGPDLLVVELAALLHDVLDRKYATPAETADPYAFFLPFFQSLAKDHELDLISDGRARLVARIIENVSWTTEQKLIAAGLIEDWHRTCVELHCVQDADRLDAIGAFGVLRCAAYGAVVNRQVPCHFNLVIAEKAHRALYVPPSVSQHTTSTIEHFHYKLVHVKDRLKTEPGRRMGIKRHQVIVDFIQSVDEEYSAKIPS
ncbi:hypothetical protein HWV62_27975 [Athelia sp. TMB]|nr:hypothetical protein HWV62_27975 [Athelia sp. TMB]